MTNLDPTVSVIGLGAMGTALAGTLLVSGHEVSVWNRTASRALPLVDAGARHASSVEDAVGATGPVVVCLFDHRSVWEVLEPVGAALTGRTVVNVTTTTPGEARQSASWAEQHGIDYLDGAIMAVPDMIGTPQAAILYSGSRRAFDTHQRTLGHWGEQQFEGTDPGAAALADLSMLSGMYAMFAGFSHGAAMMRAGGANASAFAERAQPFLAAMTQSFPESAARIDDGRYDHPGQTLAWTRSILSTLRGASRELDVDPAPVDMVAALVDEQIARGHGAADFDRLIESMHR